MKAMVRSWLFASLAFVIALPVMASETSKLVNTRSKSGDPITLGKWHCNFDKAKSYATKHGYPFIAVWSNGESCSHCVRFESACNSSAFKTWMKSSGCVFYFAYSGDKFPAALKGSTEFNWIRGDNTSYPFIRVYWPKGKVDVKEVGDTLDAYKNGEAGGKKVRDYIKNLIKKYVPPKVLPKYTGGSFDAGPGVLEAEVDEAGTVLTTFVDVSLTRTNGTVIAMASTNTVHVAYPDGTVATNTIYWAKGDVETNVTVAVDAAHSFAGVGQVVTLELYDDGGDLVETNTVTTVREPENSPKNPRWIGERTAETLAWGEWTMDIDVATNKVNATEGAYSLLLIGGPLWCPDCINVEERLFATDAFREWAAGKKVACVAIDEAPFARSSGTTTAPTLLSREVDPKTGLSGAGYISRKMVTVRSDDPDDAATAERVFERNLGYVMNDTEHGGFCTPDNTSGSGNAGAWKTGIPCVIALRRDGTVAGRLYQFSNDFRDASRTNTPAEILVKRLDELFAQVDDPAEDLNDSRRTTTETVGMREELAERTLSFADGADVYRLDPAETVGRRINFTVDAAAGTTLQVDVIKVVSDRETVIASVAGAEYPLEIGAEIATSNSFVRISYPVDANGYAVTNEYGATFSIANPGSTLFPYVLKTDFVVQPTDVAETVAVTGESVMTVAFVSNQVYRISGLAEPLPEGLTAVEGSEGLYLSELEGDVRVALDGLEATIQRWNPGTAGFAFASASVAESSEVYELRLVRTGGVSGRAVVTLALDESTPLMDELLGFDFSGEYVWEEGESDEKTVPIEIVDNGYADGNLTFVFDASVSGDAAAGTDRFRLTLRDNDRRLPGKAAIAGATPELAKGMTAFARKGDSAEVVFERTGGADGALEVSLAASAGTLSAAGLVWENRSAASQAVSLDLPASGKSVKVTMTPAKGSAVDASRRVLTVNLLDADVPGFAASRLDVPATRYVPVGSASVAVDPAYVTDWSKVKVTKYSGALPAGMTWRYDAGAKALVVTGTPSKAGVATAVFRVSEGSKAGLTVPVVVDVTDPVTKGGGLTGAEPLNASVATSRTFSSLPVVDLVGTNLAGTLTLTVPRTGRLSAKYLTVDAAKACAFSSKSWSEITEDGVLRATLAGTVAGGEATLEVEASPDGAVSATLSYPARPAGGLGVLFPEVPWSKKNPATDFRGYYTVELVPAGVRSGTLLARGSGYVTLKMSSASAVNAGKVAYAGLLPNGKGFSGSATLMARDWIDDPDFLYWSRGIVPLLTVGATDTLAGAVEVNPGAADPEAKDYDAAEGVATGRCYHKYVSRTVRDSEETRGLLWRHVEKAGAASAEATLSAWGAYYDAADDFRTCCMNATGADGSLRFYALEGLDDLPDEVLAALARGAWGAAPTNVVAGVTVSFAKATKTAKTKTSAVKSANATKLPLSFTLSTGVVKGTFKLTMSDGRALTLSYQGVVKPGFGTGACVECGGIEGFYGAEAALRPFVAGTAWFNDTLTYGDAAGKTRTATVRRSTPFSIGVNPGE